MSVASPSSFIWPLHLGSSTVPFPIAVKGPSSGGKSFTVKSVLRFFPGEAFRALTAMSDRALAYSTEPLKHGTL